MISVEVFGQDKRTERIECMCNEVLQYLMPRKRKDVDVEVHFVQTCDNNIAGDCYGDRDEVFINIAKNSYGYKYSFSEQILTLCHELVHAKQFLTGELDGSSKGVVWKGVDFSLIRQLSKQPWEQEAFRLENTLYDKYFEKYYDRK